MEESLPKLEEKILRFWKDRGIFGKSLSLRKRSRPFRFFEGPPTANASPGIHHMLSRVFKDIICRYKTMRGFYVERKAGWDTHGLPVELQIEKELGIKHKSEIEKFGIAEFNKKAKDAVWHFKDEWERFTERIGFWLDMENPYVTYDTSYMESLWWVIRQLWDKKLFEEDYKVVPYCPRCETPLSSHEVAQGYKTVKDPSVFLKLKISAKGGSVGGGKNEKLKIREFLLVWTTTPWTLPGNVAVAVNPHVSYTKYKIGNEYYWSVNAPPHSSPDGVEVVEKRAGKSLVGLKYEPIFSAKGGSSPEANAPREHASGGETKIKDKRAKIYLVVAGDFVSTEEGTGLVHIAPAFGEDDMKVAKKADLPVVLNVGPDGAFSFSVEELRAEPFFKRIQKKLVKDADPIIFEELKKRGILYKGDLRGTEHEYPFCWRCDTPLLYYAHKSWFVRMSRLREELLKNNDKISWIPAHLKDGRFGEWLREVKDWAFSRERYWGTPLPIWVCERCGKKEAIGSLAELNKKAFKPNKFFMIRHGEADHIRKNYIAAWPEPSERASHLTEKGKREVTRAARALAKNKIDFIVSSDLVRMKETTAILKKHMPKARVLFDPRLRELNTGIYNYRQIPEYRRFFKKPMEKFFKAPSGGETLTEARMRYFSVWKELNRKYRGKNILVVGHGDPLWVFEGKLKGSTPEQILKAEYIEPGEWRMLPKNDLPYNDEGEIDLHRPYVDALQLACDKCKSAMQRVGGVADVWFDSGSMPFAQVHWPFAQIKNSKLKIKNLSDNKQRELLKNISFPADYIAEAVDQTRGWFYTLLAVSTALGYGSPYLNVICLGHILDGKGEKMSKSKGNVVNPWEMMTKYGADSVRWYFFIINPPGEPKRFSERDLSQKHQQMLLALNVLNFFKTYAPRKIHANHYRSKLTLLDKWILAKLSLLIETVGAELDKYEITQAGRALEAFFDDLSRWYVRRSRRRFQKPKSQKDLTAASSVLANTLIELSKLLAPFTPFLAEHIWHEVKPRIAGKKLPESVHLANWPKPKKIAGSQTLLTKMQAVRDLAGLGLKLRQAASIKVRQPLAGFSVLKKRDCVRIDKDLSEILAEELNVKTVSFVNRLPAQAGLPEEPGWLTDEIGDWKVSLDTRITSKLKQEGELRELVRHIQELRQELSLNPKDRITVYISSNKLSASELRRNSDNIKKEVGAVNVIFAKTQKYGALREYARGDGAPIWIAVKK